MEPGSRPLEKENVENFTFAQKKVRGEGKRAG